MIIRMWHAIMPESSAPSVSITSFLMCNKLHLPLLAGSDALTTALALAENMGPAVVVAQVAPDRLAVMLAGATGVPA